MRRSSPHGHQCSQPVTRGWAVPRFFQTTGNADTLIAEAVTAGYADVFRLRAQVGRWISSQDDVPGAEPVAVISDRIWRAWFGANRAVVGRARLKLNRQPLTIIGVAPMGFRDATGFADVWLPTTSYGLLLSEESRTFLARRDLTAQIIVRVIPNTPRAQAAAAIAAAVRQTPSGGDPSVSVAGLPLSDNTRLHGLLTLGLMILGISSLVLLPAAANLANLLYARGIQRAAEIAVRVSLGASRIRIGRLFLLEAGIIAGLATALGLALAVGGLSAFSARFPALRIDRYVPIVISVAPDRRIFIFALAAGFSAAMFVGLTTAWRVTRVQPLRTLASAGAASGLTPRTSWVRTALVSLQITAAVVLVMIAGAFLHNLPAGLNKQLHFDTTHVVAGHLDLKRYGYTDDRGKSFLNRLVSDVRRLPGVEAASYGDSVPSGVEQASPTGVTLTPEGRREGELVEARSLSASYSAVSPGYLRMGSGNAD